ncbi:RHS repeat-associated core domain-containing protein [Pseudomonas sp. NPDC089569]|uniref:RHS repeat-associated core domain-containing protein n=1 Tax=Pseudomonas sp. NPDC089569 TaxID=3390722 RepID=UPI003D035D90
MSLKHCKVELCHYYYDPLDQQISVVLSEQDIAQRFYCRNNLVTVIQGAERSSIFRCNDQALAQFRGRIGNTDTSLLAIDQKKTVLNVFGSTWTTHSIAYTPYGYHQAGNVLTTLLGFNGESFDYLTGSYHLGRGYRQFNPVLMRFCSPDNISPFGKGGMNAYAYCGGEPVMRFDPDGHFFASALAKPFLNVFTSRQSSSLLAKQLRSAKVVRVDNVEIKAPRFFKGENYFGQEVFLSKTEYVKLNKVKLKLDQYASGVDRENSRLIKVYNLDEAGIKIASVTGSSSYQYKSPSGKPLVELLGSIKRVDAVLETNDNILRRLAPVAQTVSGIRR